MQPRHQEAKPRHQEAKKASKTALKAPAIKAVAKTSTKSAPSVQIPKLRVEKLAVAPKVAVAAKVAVAPKPVPAKPVAPAKVEVKAVAPAIAPPPVRATAPVDAFKVGDHAVYPARGVAEVVSIEEKDIAGKRQAFYVLRLLDTDHKIMVPVANASSIGLRKPISENEIRRIFQILKVKDVPIDTQTWNRRQRAFVEKLSTGSVFEVAEVMRDLERVKDVKDALSFSERQMLERARQLLVKEIAVSRNKSDDTVRAQIDAVFGGASRQTPVKSN
jgi:CarD family transcriptional regulator